MTLCGMHKNARKTHEERTHKERSPITQRSRSSTASCSTKTISSSSSAHPQLFSEIEWVSPSLRRPVLHTSSLFNNVKDDVAVLMMLGKYDFYKHLWINLNEFYSEAAVVYSAIASFDLTSLEIVLDCRTIARFNIVMPHLDKFVVTNAAKCDHSGRTCVVSDLVAASKRLKFLKVENAVIEHLSIVCNTVLLETLWLKMFA